MPDGHRRRIRNYLIDRKLQLRYTLIMVALSSLLTAGLGYVWYNQMRETSKTVEVKALGSMDVDSQEISNLEDELRQQDHLRLMVLVGFGVLFALVVSLYGIALTHKIAGPLYKIGSYMDQVKSGRLGQVYGLRRGDQLQEFFKHFKEMHAALVERELADIAAMERMVADTETALASIEDTAIKEPLSKQLVALRKLLQDKQARLDQAA